MKPTFWVTAAAIALVGAGIFVWQATSGGGEPAVELPPTPLPTETPDVDAAVSPAEATSQLLQVRNVGDVVDAVEARDLGRFLSLIAWEPYPCGVRNSELCPAGVDDGTELPMVNTFHEFWVTVGPLRPVIERIFANSDVQLTFASRASETPEGKTGNFYFLGYEGAVSDTGLAPVEGFPFPTGFTGFLLTLDSSKATPILAFDFLRAGWSVTRQVREGVVLDLSKHEIITWPAEQQ